MNMSTVSAFRPAMNFRPAAAPRRDDPTPAPTPAPAPPAPTPPPAPADIDFSNVDSANKAALLPSLSAASFLLTLSAISNAAQAGATFTSSLQATFGQSTPANLSFQMADPTQLNVTGSGTIGGNNANETWSLDQNGGLLITGQYGNSAEKFSMTQQQDGIHVDGTVGNIDVHETITNSADGSGLVWAGTIGGQPLAQTLTIAQNDDGSTGLHVVGTLGATAIKYDENIAQTDSGVSMTGSGNIAGNNIQVTHTVNFQMPQQQPDPGDPGNGGGSKH